MASHYGKYEVVRYILQNDQIREHDKKHKLINQKDSKGNTPLHLAAKSFHPKTVFYLIWDKRVNYDLVNQNNQTPLDVANEISQLGRSSTRQQLTRTALNSVGAKSSFKRVLHSKWRQSDSNSAKSKQKESDTNPNESNEIVSNTAQYFFLAGADTQYKDRVETLILVSTLIITASVAACFAVPGEADGRALISLTLAFMAGLYTVISPLRWLANLFLVVAVIFVVLVVLLYTVLFLPSASTRKAMRYISYYPFLFLAWLAE
ncbi:unnamed protein product [Lathyrus sativus]|nr:unnamed protein product [Lathyrus sativus]